jgi:uncharacterized damage-inducible protein DinB
MQIDTLIDQWKDIRQGLIDEVLLIPDEKLDFKAAPETRSISELIRHIIQSQKMIVGEVCRPDTNFAKGFPALIQEHASSVESVSGKDALIDALRKSMEEAEAKIRAFGDDALQESMVGITGKQTQKFNSLNFIMGHEFYHRGQLTVYLRLLGTEPALTTRFNKLIAARA